MLSTDPIKRLKYQGLNEKENHSAKTRTTNNISTVKMTDKTGSKGAERDCRNNSGKFIGTKQYIQSYITQNQIHSNHNPNSKPLVNLFKLTIIIAFVNYELMVDQQARSWLVEAKSRGLIYNKDGKFIYRPAKPNQGHIIVIDDRHRDDTKRDHSPPSQTPGSNGNAGAESIFQPVQVMSSRLFAASPHTQLTPISIRGFPLATSSSSTTAGTGQSSQASFVQLASIDGQPSVLDHIQRNSGSPIQPVAASSNTATPTTLQVIPMVQLVEPTQSRLQAASRVGGLGIQLIQPSHPSRLSSVSPQTAASLAHELLAPMPNPMLRSQSPYDPTSDSHLSGFIFPIGDSVSPMAQAASPFLTAATGQQVTSQANQALDDSLVASMRPPTAQSVQLLSSSHQPDHHHQHFLRLYSASLAASQQPQPLIQHSTASMSSSGQPMPRSFLSHDEQSNRLDDFDIDEDHQDSGSPRPSAQSSPMARFANSRRSKGSSSPLDPNPLPGIMPNSNGPAYRDKKSSRYADSAAAIGLDSPTNSLESFLSHERNGKNTRRLNYSQSNAANLTGDARRQNLSINLDGYVDADRDQRSSRYWNQYRDQFEVIP